MSRRTALWNLGRGPGCAREGVFRLQAAGEDATPQCRIMTALLIAHVVEVRSMMAFAHATSIDPPTPNLMSPIVKGFG
jgi:hypothetical protein